MDKTSKKELVQEIDTFVAQNPGALELEAVKAYSELFKRKIPKWAIEDTRIPFFEATLQALVDYYTAETNKKISDSMYKQPEAPTPTDPVIKLTAKAHPPTISLTPTVPEEIKTTKLKTTKPKDLPPIEPATDTEDFWKNLWNLYAGGASIKDLEATYKISKSNFYRKTAQYRSKTETQA